MYAIRSYYAQLEEALKHAVPADRPGYAEALTKAREAERAVREKYFGDLESMFSKQVQDGEYGRARERNNFV